MLKQSTSIMNDPIDSIRQVRQHLLQHTRGLTVAEMNLVPPGFHNNIAWNLAHLVASQQGLCYLRSGLKPVVPQAFIDLYKSGTRPESALSEGDIASVREMLLSTMDLFEEDYRKKRFTSYSTANTRYGVVLSNIDEALDFLLFHEGLHTGYVWALQRAVKACENA
jgi:hypothetical protein